jgi:hypothetical protein
MRTTAVATTLARIYVADLAAYNSGILFGTWIDLTPDTDIDFVTETVAEMLKEGTERFGAETCSTQHEEWSIHDYEGFGPIKLEEYAPFEEILRHVDRMGTDSTPYFAFIDSAGTGCADEFEDYEPRGPYEEDVDWSWEFLEDFCGVTDLTGWLEHRGLPKDIASCIKFDAADFVFSARANGEIAVGRWNGKTFVFELKR